jgi:hypothetical protein
MADVALNELEMNRKVRADATDALKLHTLGVLQTSWGGLADFVQAYYGEGSPSPDGVKAAECFKALFREIRQEN